MIALAVSGAKGRMGQKITQLALKQPETFKLTALLEHKNHPENKTEVHGIPLSTDNAALKGCNALIEFTLPEGTMENLAACVKHNVGMVIGTTGFSTDQIKEIEEASKKIPVVFASNMSVGVNLLFKITELVAGKIGQCKINISETHHIHKKDKPSGTAKTLAEVAEQASGLRVEQPIESKREGEVIGDHEIVFETEYDTIRLSHHAKDRDMFAKGALEAVKFLQDKKSGLFDMQQVLGLR
jgi:4-hydroxy-tetrahydrodipicolinate reductase